MNENIENVFGIFGFAVALAFAARATVYASDYFIQRLFGVWNPLEELDLDPDEI